MRLALHSSHPIKGPIRDSFLLLLTVRISPGPIFQAPEEYPLNAAWFSGVCSREWNGLIDEQLAICYPFSCFLRSRAAFRDRESRFSLKALSR